jgi:uncharacterized membrane protein (UPF0127 family)
VNGRARLSRAAAVLVAGVALAVSACSSDERAVTIVDVGSETSVVGRTLPPSGVDPSAVDSSAVGSAAIGSPAGGTLGPSGLDPSAVVGDSTTAPLPGPYRTVSVTLTRADGTTFDWCLLVADTEALRERGLMGVTDLAGFDGMLFRFGEDQLATFWMKDTLIPLSVVFFSGAGDFVSSTSMTPCPPDASATCERYSASGSYADAIETAQGAVAKAAIGPGTKLAVHDKACGKR